MKYPLRNYLPDANKLNLHESITHPEIIKNLVLLNKSPTIKELKDNERIFCYKMDKNKFMVLKLHETYESTSGLVLVFKSNDVFLEVRETTFNNDALFKENIYVVSKCLISDHEVHRLSTLNLDVEKSEFVNFTPFLTFNDFNTYLRKGKRQKKVYYKKNKNDKSYYELLYSESKSGCKSFKMGDYLIAETNDKLNELIERKLLGK